MSTNWPGRSKFVVTLRIETSNGYEHKRIPVYAFEGATITIAEVEEVEK